MTEGKMVDRLYQLYQLDWLMSHGYSLTHVFNVLQAAEEAGKKGRQKVVYFFGHGFDGQIFSGFEEFCATELTDGNYIDNLIERAPADEQDALDEAYGIFKATYGFLDMSINVSPEEEQRILNLIRDQQCYPIGKICHMTDGSVVIRAKLTEDMVQQLKKEPGVISVQKTAFLSPSEEVL